MDRRLASRFLAPLTCDSSLLRNAVTQWISTIAQGEDGQAVLSRGWTFHARGSAAAEAFISFTCLAGGVYLHSS